MTEKKTPKKRTQIKDLPKKEKELTREEQKQVQGGARGLAVGIRTVGSGLGSQEDPQA